MHIRSIRLRDWKAFQEALFEFPRPTQKKNVVLIGALNGYGKTSLLEAVVLGLFGRDGLGVIARAVIQDGETEKLSASYDDFLQRAFHAKALEQGRTSASIEIVLEDEGELTTVHRLWHFTGAGKHLRQDEELRLYRGEDREPVRVPRMDDVEDFRRNFVAQHFLPVHLAQFFLFDGEQVQRLAKRDMSAQVRLGIEGILGVPILRELEQDLRSYAQARRNVVPKVGDETVERTRAEVREIEARVKDEEAELAQLTPQLTPLKTRRDQLTREIGSLHGGSYADLRELLETQSRHERERDRLRERLAALLQEDLAIAIAGKELRTATRARLIAEEERAKWENGKQQSDGGLAKLMRGLSVEEPPVQPRLKPQQLEGVRDWVRRAWESAWHPPPPQCADGFRHRHLASGDRAIALARLDKADKVGLASLQSLLDALDQEEAQVRKAGARISQRQGVDEKFRQSNSDLEAVKDQVVKLEARERDLSRALDGDRALLTPLRQKLTAMLEGQERAQPNLRRAAYGDRIAELIEAVIAESYPLHIGTVSEVMTAAYKAMAHKSLLKKVQIDPDCSVRLLGDGGRDMRDLDASAGENQIFALSLIGAIAKVSQRQFPILMDTPLARLDRTHRLNVLKYFTQRSGEQVILLSQPDEVHGEYLKAIQDRVCVSYRMEHEELSNGVGRTRAVKGYF